MRALTRILVVVVGLTGPALGWPQFPESERTGVIQAVELDNSSLIISGLRYRVPLDAHIEIGGTFGALQLLQDGMKVRFVCRVLSGVEREIVRLETLPDQTAIEQA